jgi:hypothetical protein
VDTSKQIAALTVSGMQTAGASQATAIALHVLIRHLKSPELLAELTTAFEQHQALMLQKPWPEQMLASFEATRRFLESAARNDNGPDAPGKAG